MGTALPSDYRDLVDTYGGFGVADSWFVHHPGSVYDLLDLVGEAKRCAEFIDGCRAVRSAGLRAGVAGGLLIWGSTDDGSVLLWDTLGPPDEWTVVVLPRDGDQFERFEGGVVDFLVEVLGGRRFWSVMPDDFPERPELTALPHSDPS